MNGWSWYWLAWFEVSILAFLGPELYALFTRHNENTLSANIWRLEQVQTGQSLWQWTALHFLVGGSLALLLVWLIFHLVFGIWR